MKRDLYDAQRRFLVWREKTKDGICGLSAASLQLLHQFLSDMELGLNVARGSKKGGRSYVHLNTMRYRLVFVFCQLEAREGVSCVTAVSARQVHALIAAMRSGEIRRKDGGVYRSAGDYAKEFASFWHWHMRVQRNAGVVVQDICIDLDTSTPKPPWVYLTKDEFFRLYRAARPRYQVMLLFMFDTGIRSPGELSSLLVSDVLDDGRKVCIREEVSKTFGRTISLVFSTDRLREYIREQGLQPNDWLFTISAPVVNRYLKRLAKRLFGTEQTQGGKRYCDLTMYDLRHSSACFFRTKYAIEAAYKYRFGWVREEMVRYYTEFVGMNDTLTNEDLLSPEQTSDLKRQLAGSEAENAMLKEQVTTLQGQMDDILARVSTMVRRVT